MTRSCNRHVVQELTDFPSYLATDPLPHLNFPNAGWVFKKQTSKRLSLEVRELKGVGMLVGGGRGLKTVSGCYFKQAGR